MPAQAFSSEVEAVLDAYVAAAQEPVAKTVTVDGSPVAVPYPCPSPADWRDCWIYFLMIVRFNNSAEAPAFD